MPTLRLGFSAGVREVEKRYYEVNESGLKNILCVISARP